MARFGRSQPIQTLVVRRLAVPVVSNPKAETLTDDFASQIDSAKWVSTSSSTAVWESGRANVTAATGSLPTGLTSVSKYDLYDSSVHARLWPSTPSTSWVYLMAGNPLDSKYFYARIKESALEFNAANSGAITMTPASITYDSVAHAYVQLSIASGQLIVKTSPDAVTWTQQSVGTLAGTFWNAVNINLFSELSAVAYFDNINVVPPVSGTSTIGGVGAVTANATVITPVAFSDNFNRVDDTTLGNDWLGGLDWGVIGRAAAPDNLTSYTTWNTPTSTDDNYSQITITNKGGASTLGVVARWTGTTENGYIWRSNTGELTLFSVVSGTYTQIGAPYAHTLVNGTVLKLSAVGTTITGYLNGVAVVTLTDSSVTVGKNVGMRADSACRLDDWSGGDVTATLVFATGDVVGSGATTAVGSAVSTIAGTASVAGVGSTSARAVLRSASSSAGVGAITANATVTTPTVTTGRPKVYTGSYVTKPGKVYMGSGPGFVEKPWKRWTGTMWLKLGEEELAPSTETKLIAQYHGDMNTSFTVPMTATTPGRALLAIGNSTATITMPAGWIESRIYYSVTHLAIWRLDPSLHTTSLTSVAVGLAAARQLSMVIVEDDIYNLSYVNDLGPKINNVSWWTEEQTLGIPHGLVYLALFEPNGTLDVGVSSYNRGFTALADTGNATGMNAPYLDEGVRLYVGENHDTSLSAQGVYITLASPGEGTDGAGNNAGIVAWTRGLTATGTTASLFSDAQVAYDHTAADSSGVTVGTEFSVSSPAKLTAIRFLMPSASGSYNYVPRQCALYAVGSGALVAGPYTMPTPTTPGAWVTYTMTAAYPLSVGSRYRVGIFHPSGHYCYYPGGHYFDTTGPGATTTLINGFLTRYNRADSSEQGSYHYSGTIGYPDGSFNAGCYFADVIVETT